MKRSTVFVLIAITLCAVLLLAYSYMCFGRASIRKLLKVGVQEFNNEKDLTYWVDYGTLLGLRRNNDVILWDNDVDICVLDHPQLHEKLWSIAGRLDDHQIVWTRVAGGIYRFYHRCLPVLYHADVYVYVKDGDMLRGPEGSKSDVPSDLVGNRQDMQWQGLSVKTPEKIHETLVWRYGENYMTPRPLFKGRGA